MSIMVNMVRYLKISIFFTIQVAVAVLINYVLVSHMCAFLKNFGEMRLNA
jgi:hypothetical protein